MGRGGGADECVCVCGWGGGCQTDTSAFNEHNPDGVSTGFVFLSNQMWFIYIYKIVI